MSVLIVLSALLTGSHPRAAQPHQHSTGNKDQGKRAVVEPPADCCMEGVAGVENDGRKPRLPCTGSSVLQPEIFVSNKETSAGALDAPDYVGHSLSAFVRRVLLQHTLRMI